MDEQFDAIKLGIEEDSRKTLPVPKTLWEGELEMKSGTLAKKRVLAVLLEDDPHFYMVSQEFYAKSSDSQTDFTATPYIPGLRSRRLKPGWYKYSLDADKCIIMPSGSNKNFFTLLFHRSDEQQLDDEMTFSVLNFCQKQAWLRKLRDA